LRFSIVQTTQPIGQRVLYCRLVFMRQIGKVW